MSTTGAVLRARHCVLVVPASRVGRLPSTVSAARSDSTDRDGRIVGIAYGARACRVVRCKARFVKEMGYSLAELDACCAVTVLHRYAPENVCKVELDLEVSMVRHREAAENIRVT